MDGEMRKVEKGRAEFAYNCVDEVIRLSPINHGAGRNLIEETIKRFKDNVEKKLRKDIEEGKITPERIREILADPTSSIKQSLNETEETVIKYYTGLLENYKSYSKKMPTMILSNGLGQTLAFTLSKKKEGNAWEFLYAHITAYLKSKAVSRINMPEGEPDLCKWVVSRDSSEYRYITKEILSFLHWLQRFTQGKVEDSDERKKGT